MYFISIVMKNGFASGGVVIENDKVVRCPPIFYKSLIGKSLEFVKEYVKQRKGEIEHIE